MTKITSRRKHSSSSGCRLLAKVGCNGPPLTSVLRKSLALHQRVARPFCDVVIPFRSGASPTSAALHFAVIEISYHTFMTHEGIGIDGKDIRIIRNLYWEQTSCIRIGEEVTDQTSIQRGVRQGCVMSPSLFNLYTEIIFRNINELPGMNISGQNINNIRYADDTALVAETPEQLQALLDKVNEESENCGLAMNAKKTKVMVISRKDITPKININIGNTNIHK
ncbi:hypothetical protein EGW08_023338 [Elysia chlorotica]|uniref:Reverse transcriptase domain-containing protein n=1 Tax=Elysia chlorotica TaxID=188477 RepID=A0A433SIR0_ELYCH|nr:hypothetical protein EGW08_023338 [Elysia chlorotica]